MNKLFKQDKNDKIEVYLVSLLNEYGHCIDLKHFIPNLQRTVTYSPISMSSKRENYSSTHNEINEEMRRSAIESLMKETSKRKKLADSIGVEAFYTDRYSPARTDQGFVRRQLMHVYGHNKRWEEEKCWTIKKNLDKLDGENRKLKSKSTGTDLYEDEKEHWRTKKAVVFSNKTEEEVPINPVGEVDRSNTLLFPTIESCTSSDDLKSEDDDLITKNEHKHKHKHKNKHEHEHHHRHRHYHHHHSYYVYLQQTM